MTKRYASLYRGILGLMCIGAWLLADVPSARSQEGTYGEHNTSSGHWYNTLKQKNGTSCCSDVDCRATQWRSTSTAIEVLINSKWCAVLQDKILPTQAPDGAAHVCTPAIPVGSDPCKVPVYCVVIGDQT